MDGIRWKERYIIFPRLGTFFFRAVFSETIQYSSGAPTSKTEVRYYILLRAYEIKLEMWSIFSFPCLASSSFLQEMQEAFSFWNFDFYASGKYLVFCFVTILSVERNCKTTEPYRWIRNSSCRIRIIKEHENLPGFFGNLLIRNILLKFFKV